jgi:hypothetical protein
MTKGRLESFGDDVVAGPAQPADHPEEKQKEETA